MPQIVSKLQKYQGIIQIRNMWLTSFATFVSSFGINYNLLICNNKCKPIDNQKKKLHYQSINIKEKLICMIHLILLVVYSYWFKKVYNDFAFFFPWPESTYIKTN